MLLVLYLTIAMTKKTADLEDIVCVLPCNFQIGSFTGIS